MIGRSEDRQKSRRVSNFYHFSRGERVRKYVLAQAALQEYRQRVPGVVVQGPVIVGSLEPVQVDVEDRVAGYEIPALQVAIADNNALEYSQAASLLRHSVMPMP